MNTLRQMKTPASVYRSFVGARLKGWLVKMRLKIRAWEEPVQDANGVEVFDAEDKVGPVALRHFERERRHAVFARLRRERTLLH